MPAHVDALCSSPFGKVLDFQCRSPENSVSNTEYSKSFSVNFTRRGSFVYRLGKTSYDIHGGVVLLENAGCERVVSHPNPVKDECTVLELEDDFLWQEARLIGARLPRSPEEPAAPRFSVCILTASPMLEYLHSSILKSVRNKSFELVLRMDYLLVALIREISRTLSGRSVPDQDFSVDRKMKERHLEMFERARDFLVANFRNPLSLSEIARNAHVSMFHFCRLFRSFTGRSPHRYLVDVRLKHAELLLRNTSLSVTEICFDSGFTSLEHFINTFTRRYRTSPAKYRRQK